MALIARPAVLGDVLNNIVARESEIHLEGPRNGYLTAYVGSRDINWCI